MYHRGRLCFLYSQRRKTGSHPVERASGPPPKLPSRGRAAWISSAVAYQGRRTGLFTLVDSDTRCFWTGLVYGFAFAFAGWGVIAALVLLCVVDR